MRLYRFCISNEGKRETVEAFGKYKGQALTAVYEYLTSYKGYTWENINCVCGVWLKDEFEIRFSSPVNK